MTSEWLLVVSSFKLEGIFHQQMGVFINQDVKEQQNKPLGVGMGVRPEVYRQTMGSSHRKQRASDVDQLVKRNTPRGRIRSRSGSDSETKRMTWMLLSSALAMQAYIQSQIGGDGDKTWM